MKLRTYVTALHAALFAILLVGSPAGSGSMMLMGVGGAPAGGVTFNLSYASSAISSANSTSITYGTLGYSAGATRTICVVQWYGGTGPSITSLTVGGQSFSQVSGAQASSTDMAASVWISNAPLSGSSGSVVVNYSPATTYYSAVALYNLTTTTPAAGTPATITPAGPAPTITDGPITVPSGGGAVFATFAYSGATGTITSGNATIDAFVSAASANFYFGHTTAVGSQSVTFTYSASDRGPATLVPWGP
jgi:hypothetical protein